MTSVQLRALCLLIVAAAGAFLAGTAVAQARRGGPLDWLTLSLAAAMFAAATYGLVWRKPQV